MKKVVLLILPLLLAASAQAKELVREFTGQGNTTTASFTVESPWIIDWRLDGDYDTLVALDVTLIEADSGRNVGRVVYVKARSNGVRLFNLTGRYQLRVSSTLARWRLKVEQLTEEEAEQYTPRRPEKKDPFQL